MTHHPISAVAVGIRLHQAVLLSKAVQVHDYDLLRGTQTLTKDSDFVGDLRCCGAHDGPPDRNLVARIWSSCGYWFSGKPGISTNGRISTVPLRAAGICAAISMASSRSLASTRKYPP